MKLLKNLAISLAVLLVAGCDQPVDYTKLSSDEYIFTSPTIETYEVKAIHITRKPSFNGGSESISVALNALGTTRFYGANISGPNVSQRIPKYVDLTREDGWIIEDSQPIYRFPKFHKESTISAW